MSEFGGDAPTILAALKLNSEHRMLMKYKYGGDRYNENKNSFMGMRGSAFCRNGCRMREYELGNESSKSQG